MIKQTRVLMAVMVATFGMASFSAFATYPIDAVIDACEGAYGSDSQIATCINSVCGRYGCS